MPICVLGTAFKPETNLETGSPSILFINLLKNQGIECDTYDPYINPDKQLILEKKIYFIGCKHKVFKFYNFPEGSVVVDPNRYIPQQEGVDVVQVGICKK